MSKIAIVQKPPAFMHKQKTIEIAVTTVEEAASKGAQLVVFSEAFIPGYPAWIWRLKPGGDYKLSEELHERLLINAIVMESNDLLPLYEAAREFNVTIVCGIEERDSRLVDRLYITQ